MSGDRFPRVTAAQLAEAADLLGEEYVEAAIDERGRQAARRMREGLPPDMSLAGIRGRKPIQLTAHDRFLVETWARVGTPHEVIAQEMGISVETLLRNFGDVLENAHEKGVAQIAATLYAKAALGDGPSMQFYLKTRGGWKEKQAGDEDSPLHVKGDINVAALAQQMREARLAGQKTIEQETDK